MGEKELDEKEMLEENYRYNRNSIHFKWSISVLIFIVILILSYKFWGKSGNLENLISIGSGLVSMSLALVAIFIALSEGVKTSIKEARLDGTLCKITSNTEKTEDILNKIHHKVENIDSKTDKFDTNLTNLAKGYSDSAGTPSNDADKLQSHFETGDNIGRDKKIIKKETPTNTTSLSGKVDATSNVTAEVTVRQDRIFKGKVYYADLGPAVGSEQSGKRPVVIVSNEVVNKFSSLITIVPISRINKKIPTHVSLGFFLNRDFESFAIVEHIRTVDRSRLLELVDALDEDTITKIDHAIQIQMGIVDYQRL